MKFFRYFFIIIFLTHSLYSDVKVDLKNEYYFGITISKFNQANQNRIKYLLIKLENDLQESYKVKINIVFVEDNVDLIKNYKSFEKFNALIVYSSFYLKYKEELKSISKKPFLFNTKGDQKNQYYLVANKTSKIKSIKDLKDKTFATYVGDEGYEIWLDYLIRKRLNTSIEKVVKEKNTKQKNQKLLLDVYFNKSDFTVISKAVYEDMILLNPAMQKNLQIIEKSDPIFFFALGLFHKNTPKKIVDHFYTLVNTSEFNKKFSDLFKILNLYGLQKTSFDELKKLDNYFDNYNKLKIIK